MALAVRLMGPADEQRIPLQLVEVEKEAIHADVASVPSAGHAPRQVGQSLLHPASPGDGLPTSGVLFGHGVRRPTDGVHLRICLLHQRGPQHIRKVLGPTADRDIAVGGVPARGAYRYEIVEFHAHPSAVLVDPSDVHRPPHIPAIEQSPRELRAKSDSLHCLRQVPCIQRALPDAAEVRGMGARLVEEVASVGVVCEINQAHPSALAEFVHHMARNRRLAQPGCQRIERATHVVLLVVGRERDNPVGGHRAPQAQVGEGVWIVDPARVRAEALHVPLVNRALNGFHMQRRQHLLLVAVAFGVKPTSIVKLNAMVVMMTLLALLALASKRGARRRNHRRRLAHLPGGQRPHLAFQVRAAEHRCLQRGTSVDGSMVPLRSEGARLRPEGVSASHRDASGSDRDAASALRCGNGANKA
mmetsp:Transcript_123298/g.356274  ORF Transcript_123298/g.356274 Transcript_123298/m.356274 type:complete len:416 (-) Transcript_123298:12-1259(-)